VLLTPLPLKIAVDSAIGDHPLPVFLQAFGPAGGGATPVLVDDDRLDGRGVVLDAVDGVGGALLVAVRQRETLEVAEKVAAEVEHELLAGVRAEHAQREQLQLREEGHGQEQGDGEDQYRGRAAARGPERLQEDRQRVVADGAVDGDLQR
jgi:hypothetical protein